MLGISINGNSLGGTDWALAMQITGSQTLIIGNKFLAAHENKLQQRWQPNDEFFELAQRVSMPSWSQSYGGSEKITSVNPTKKDNAINQFAELSFTVHEKITNDKALCAHWDTLFWHEGYQGNSSLMSCNTWSNYFFPDEDTPGYHKNTLCFFEAGMPTQRINLFNQRLARVCQKFDRYFLDVNNVVLSHTIHPSFVWTLRWSHSHYKAGCFEQCEWPELTTTKQAASVLSQIGKTTSGQLNHLSFLIEKAEIATKCLQEKKNRTDIIDAIHHGLSAFAPAFRTALEIRIHNVEQRQLLELNRVTVLAGRKQQQESDNKNLDLTLSEVNLTRIEKQALTLREAIDSQAYIGNTTFIEKIIDHILRILPTLEETQDKVVPRIADIKGQKEQEMLATFIADTDKSEQKIYSKIIQVFNYSEKLSKVWGEFCKEVNKRRHIADTTLHQILSLKHRTQGQKKNTDNESTFYILILIPPIVYAYHTRRDKVSNRIKKPLDSKKPIPVNSEKKQKQRGPGSSAFFPKKLSDDRSNKTSSSFNDTITYLRETELKLKFLEKQLCSYETFVELYTDLLKTKLFEKKIKKLSGKLNKSSCPLKQYKEELHNAIRSMPKHISSLNAHKNSSERVKDALLKTIEALKAKALPLEYIELHAILDEIKKQQDHQHPSESKKTKTKGLPRFSTKDASPSCDKPDKTKVVCKDADTKPKSDPQPLPPAPLKGILRLERRQRVPIPPRNVDSGPFCTLSQKTYHQCLRAIKTNAELLIALGRYELDPKQGGEQLSKEESTLIRSHIPLCQLHLYQLFIETLRQYCDGANLLPLIVKRDILTHRYQYLFPKDLFEHSMQAITEHLAEALSEETEAFDTGRTGILAEKMLHNDQLKKLNLLKKVVSQPPIDFLDNTVNILGELFLFYTGTDEKEKALREMWKWCFAQQIVALYDGIRPHIDSRNIKKEDYQPLKALRNDIVHADIDFPVERVYGGVCDLVSKIQDNRNESELRLPRP